MEAVKIFESVVITDLISSFNALTDLVFVDFGWDSLKDGDQFYKVFFIKLLAAWC